MTVHLLDVNVLVALFDPAHMHHEPAHQWFAKRGRRAWATCPLTETGCVRVISNPAYPNALATVGQAIAALRYFKENHRTHQFWADDVSLTDETVFFSDRFSGHQQVTDLYLLGLCQRYQGKLATFDGRLSSDAIVHGKAELVERIS